MSISWTLNSTHKELRFMTPTHTGQYRHYSRNGFPRWICDKLINIYTSQSSKPTHDESITEPTIPIIWIKLPFIGKNGYFLLRKCTRKISRLLKQPVKFVNHWEITDCNIYTSQKDPTPKPYKSSIVYKFVCPSVMLLILGKQIDASTVELMNTRSQISLKFIIMYTNAIILNMFSLC